MAKGWKLFATINELQSKYVTVDKAGYTRPMTVGERYAAERLENKRWNRAINVEAPRYNRWLSEEIARIEAEEKEKKKAKAKKKKKKDTTANEAWKKEKQQRHLDTIKSLKEQSEKR